MDALLQEEGVLREGELQRFEDGGNLDQVTIKAGFPPKKLSGDLNQTLAGMKINNNANLVVELAEDIKDWRLKEGPIVTSSGCTEFKVNSDGSCLFNSVT